VASRSHPNPPWVLEWLTRCSTKNPKGAAARSQLANGEDLRWRLEPCLYKARQDTRLAKARKRMIFGRASAHDVEAARRDGSAR
jgi:hypothetical protein